ncbi:MAG: hypothetical protein ACI3XQ_07645, partial [Eubacteriales bacterium]
MNKRLICLILSLLMLLSGCLAGCSQKTSDEVIDDTNEEASKSTITLAMYLVSENEVSEEQATAIQDAVNKITKSKFKTRLMLYFFTEDQYYTALEDAFKAHDDAEEAKKAAQESLKQAIKDAEAKGYLGDNIMGSDFSCRIIIKQGAGAFVCGEETALIESLQGARGMPRLKPPFPAQAGYWYKPSNINNVETYANVPWI